MTAISYQLVGRPASGDKIDTEYVDLLVTDGELTVVPADGPAVVVRQGESYRIPTTMNWSRG